MKTYKYWIFREKETDEIYAYTNDKDIAKRFRQERNMNIFSLEKRNCDRYDVNMLAKEYPGNMLEDCEFNTGKCDKVHLLATSNEYTTVINKGVQITNVDVFTLTWMPITLFLDHIQEALNEFHYADEDLFLIPDDLSIFIRYYGHTLQ